MEQIGKYKVVRLIGEGGMGRVFEAVDPIINRRVAIKTISQAVLQNSDTRARFLREAQAAGQLSHQNLITIHDIAEDNGVPFLVMEFLEGEELTKVIEKGEFAVDMKLKIMCDVCRGLAYAHERGLVHRDIKPANIFVTVQKQVKILDFGLARGLVSDLTQTGNVVGTPSYMAPEQIRGELIDQRCDIFAAGVVLYELLSGTKPFKGDTTAATIYQVLEVRPKPLDMLDPNLPAELARIVERAIAKDANDRYQTIAEMLDDLSGISLNPEATVLFNAKEAQTREAAEEGATVEMTTVRARTPSESAARASKPAPRPPSGARPPSNARPSSSVRPSSGVRAPLAADSAAHDNVAEDDAYASDASPANAQRPSVAIWIAIAAVIVAAVAVGALYMGGGTKEPAQTQAPAPVTAAPAAPAPSSSPTAGAPASTSAPAQAPATPAPSGQAPAPPATAPATARGSAPAPAKSASAPAAPATPAPTATADTSARTNTPPPAPAEEPKPAAPPPAPVAAPPPPPAAPAPAPTPAPTPAPAPPPPAAPAENATAAVQDVLAQYKSALEARDLGALKRIWPGLSGRQESAIKAEFDNARTIAVNFKNVTPTIASATSATLVCRREYAVSTTDRRTLNTATRMTMTLEKKNGAWVIDNIRHDAER